MSVQDDYLDDNIPEHLKEVIQTKGIHREILEVRNLKAVTELCVKTTKNLRFQNLTNLLYGVAGALITFFITNYYNTKSKTDTIEIQKLKTEITNLEADFRKRLNEQNSIILELKNQSKAQEDPPKQE